MGLQLVITNAGRAALIDQGAGGWRAVRVTQVGVSATAVTPAATATALPGEIKRIATLSGEATAADVVHVTVTDETMDTYTVRSFALYLSDGTLFAIYGQAEPIVEKSAQALVLLALDIALAAIPASAITFGSAAFTNPAATTDRAGVVELATDAEAAALADRLRALTPAGAAAIFTAAAILQRLLTVDGAGSGLDADLLDGRHGSDYARLDGAPFTGAVSAPTMLIAGVSGSPNFLLLDNLVNGGRRWRVGDTGATAFGQFSITNTTDNVTPLTFTPGGHGQVNFSLDVGGALTKSGAIVWSAITDGAGSGCDADLLDGQQGSFYADVPARLGFTPLNAAAYTAADVLAKLVGVDGAGSGLDADLLDGRHGSDYARLDGAPFTGAVSAPTMLIAGVSGSPNFLLLDNLVNGGRRWRVGDTGATAFGQFSITNTTDNVTPLTFTPGGHGQVNFSLDVAGALTKSGTTVWSAMTDGAGSGCDADLLDGQQGAFYADVPARLGFTPLNAAAYTPADVLAKLVGVDGAGSGLDADLLDGWQRDDIRRWGNLLDLPASFPPSGHTHGAADLAAAFPSAKAANGYTILPNGLILQWLSVSTPTGETSFDVTWPIAFPSACVSVTTAAQISSSTNRADVGFQLIGEPGVSGATIMRQFYSDWTTSVTISARIFAIGY